MNHDHITTLKNATDPQRVAFALGLNGRGSRFFCPLCQAGGGKTPDLVIGDKGFHCFKCGEKGDVLKLIMVALDMAFPDAVAWLEKETGITSPRRRNSGTGRDKGRGEIVKPGASCEAVSPDPVNATVAAPDPAIYEAFLSSCCPVDGPPLDWLVKGKGISSDVVKSLGLRFCGKEYRDIMDALKVRFGEDALKVAGLLKKSKTTPGLVGSFWYYFANKTGFLVIPYMKDGRPVYLKARPPMSKEEAERRDLIRFLNTASEVPCLYNADILSNQMEKVLICEGESDTWTALSYGFPAVGSPGAKGFKSSWVEDFRGIEDAGGRSRVYLVMDADKAGGEGELVITRLFLKAGLPNPLKLVLPPGMDLTEYMKDGRKE